MEDTPFPIIPPQRLEDLTCRSFEELHELLLTKADCSDPAACWIWRGATMGKVVKYGSVGMGLTRGYANCGAHKVSYLLYRGGIPQGQFVLHTCDNGLCVNPRHLFLGTNKDNMADMAAKGRTGKEKRSNEAHWNCKFSGSDIDEMKRLQAAGVSQYKIAEKFNTHQPYISRILKGHVRK